MMTLCEPRGARRVSPTDRDIVTWRDISHVTQAHPKRDIVTPPFRVCHVSRWATGRRERFIPPAISSRPASRLSDSPTCRRVLPRAAGSRGAQSPGCRLPQES